MPRSGTGFGGLTLWLSEAQSREWMAVSWDEMARPDGIGCFEAHGRMVRFFLEYDTGTESQQRLMDKIQRYEQMVTDTFGVVLFWLHSAAREKAFHRALAHFYKDGEPPFVIATGSRDHGDSDGPAGSVWAVYGPARAQAQAASAAWRVRLAELPERGPREHWPSLLDKPLTEAAMQQPTIHQLRHGMTAEEMQTRGLDPATGKPTRRRRAEPEWDDYDEPDDGDDEVGRAVRHGDQAPADAPIVRGTVRRALGRTEPPHRTAPSRRDELIDVDTGQPVEPATRARREPRGPQSQPWPTTRRRDR